MTQKITNQLLSNGQLHQQHAYSQAALMGFSRSLTPIYVQINITEISAVTYGKLGGDMICLRLVRSFLFAHPKRLK